MCREQSHAAGGFGGSAVLGLRGRMSRRTRGPVAFRHRLSAVLACRCPAEFDYTRSAAAGRAAPWSTAIGSRASASGSQRRGGATPEESATAVANTRTTLFFMLPPVNQERSLGAGDSSTTLTSGSGPGARACPSHLVAMALSSSCGDSSRVHANAACPRRGSCSHRADERDAAFLQSTPRTVFVHTWRKQSWPRNRFLKAITRLRRT